MKALALFITSILLIGLTSLQAQTIILQENFNDSVPGWTVIDGNSDNYTWYIYAAGTSNLDGTDFAMIDSDESGAVNLNEELRSPVVDATGYTSLTLEFDQYFNAYTSNSTTEKGDVDIWDGTQWVNVYRTTTDIGAWSNPNHQTIDITSYANSGLRVRFHYYDANYDWYWAIDNVEITGTSPTCATASFNDIETNSPYNCGDTINLTATSYNTSNEYITPGFNIYITTDIFSNTENSITIYKNGQVYYEVPVGSVPASTTDWNLWGQYMDPTATWSFQWCDSQPDGTFPYEVYDNLSGALITSGTIDNSSQSCQTITIGTLDGASVFTGTGVTNNGNGTGTLLTAGIGAGSYDILFYYTDSVNCTDSITQTIVIQSITADAGSNQSICQGDTTTLGSSPTGTGSNNIIYTWSPSTGLSETTVANPLCFADTTTIYTVIVSDSICGADTATVTITVNPRPTADAGTDQTYCSGDTITIGGIPAATGGTSPYTYSWTPSTGLSSSSVANPTLIATSTQNYTLNITDNNGCTDTDIINITVNQSPTANAGNDQNLCSGETVILGGTPTATGGTSPYTYLWTGEGLLNTDIANPETITDTITNYTVLVTDNNGCTATDAVSINAISSQDYLGGTSATYTTSGGRFLDSGGETGNYSNNENYTITFYPCNDLKKIQLVFTSFNIQYHSTCAKDLFRVYNGPNTSSPLLSAVCGTGSIGPFTSTHSTGALTIVFTSDASITGTGWVATINQACVQSPTAYAGEDVSICSVDSLTLSGSASGGYGSPYTYTWTPATGLSNTNISNPEVTAESTTTYSLIVSDAEGCSSIADEIIVNISGENEEYVADHDATYYVSGGSFMDSGGTTGDYSYNEDVITTFMPCGDYKRVKVHFNSIDIETETNCSYDWMVVYDGPDTTYTPIVMLCGSTNSYDVIASNPTGALTFWFHSDYIVTAGGWQGDISLECMPPIAEAGDNMNVCLLGDSITIGGNPTALVNNGAGVPYTYAWTPTTGLDDASIANPTLAVTQSQTYYVEITDANGCTATDSIEIYFEDDEEIYVLNNNSEYHVNGGSFYDEGGVSGSYTYNKDYTATFYPCEDFANLKMNFTSFDLESETNCSYDYLKIYNGPDVNSPLIGTYCGTNSPGEIISTHSTGALTFVFHSDESVTGTGWAATIEKETAPMIASYTITKSCYESEGTITANVAFGFPPYTYLWSTSSTGSITTYTSAGNYYVTITDLWNHTKVDTIIVDTLNRTPIEWINAGGYYYIDGNIIGRADDHAQSAWTTGASSLNTLEANTAGFVEYTMDIDEYESGVPKAMGLSETDEDLTMGSIDYAIVFLRDTIIIYEDSITDGIKYAYNSDDVLRIERSGNNIYYKKNGQILKTTTDASISEKKLVVDISIFERNTYFEGLRTSFCVPPIGVSANITNINSETNSIVELDVTGGKSPYQFIWEALDLNNLTDSIIDTTYVGHYENLAPGNYSVNVIDAMGINYRYYFDIGEEMVWEYTSGVDITDGVILKTDADGWSTGVLQSENRIDADIDGAVELKIEDASTKMSFGLRDADNTDRDGYTGLSFGFIVDNGSLSIYEEGVLISNVATIQDGDILKVERQADDIYYMKNNVVVRSQTVVNSNTRSLSGQIGLFSIGSSIHVRPIAIFERESYYPIYTITKQCFICKPTGENALYTPLNDGIAISKRGGVQFENYTYNWYKFNEGSFVTLNETSSNLKDIEQGWYKVKITATSPRGNLYIKEYNVLFGNTIQTGSQYYGNCISHLGIESYGLYNSGGEYGFGEFIRDCPDNIEHPDEESGFWALYEVMRQFKNGWVGNTVKQIGVKKALGLSENPSAGEINDIDYAFVYNYDALEIRENGEIKYQGNYDLGDVLIIARQGYKIKYWKNETLLREVSTDPGKRLMMDGAIYTYKAYFKDINSNFCYASECGEEGANDIYNVVRSNASDNINKPFKYYVCDDQLKLTIDFSSYISQGYNMLQEEIEPNENFEIYNGKKLTLTPPSSETYQVPFENRDGCVSYLQIAINAIDCTPAENNGIVLNNYGARIIITSGYSLNMYGSIYNADGIPPHNSSAIPELPRWYNEGEIQFTKNWTNNSNGHVFEDLGALETKGVVEMIGDYQKIKGSNFTQFYNLMLTNYGKKEMFVDARVTEQLRLVNSELDVNTHTMYIDNPLPGALRRNAGYVLTYDAEAQGWLERAFNDKVEIVFPVAGYDSHNNLIYRPVGILDFSGNQNQYKVMCLAENSENAGEYKAANIDVLNDKFYHAVQQTNPEITPVNISIYYNENIDGSFQSIAHLDDELTEYQPQGVPVWKLASGFVAANATGGNTGTPSDIYNSVTTLGWSDYTHDKFALTRAGVTINTDDYGSSNEFGVTGPYTNGSNYDPALNTGQTNTTGEDVIIVPDIIPVAGTNDHYIITVNAGSENTASNINLEINNSLIIQNITIEYDANGDGINEQYPLSGDLYEILDGSIFVLHANPTPFGPDCFNNLKIELKDGLVLTPQSLDNTYQTLQISGYSDIENLSLKVFKAGTDISIYEQNGVLINSSPWDGTVDDEYTPGLYEFELSLILTPGTVLKGQIVVE